MYSDFTTMEILRLSTAHVGCDFLLQIGIQNINGFLLISINSNSPIIDQYSCNDERNKIFHRR